jgi:hypothetical protein
VPLDHSLAVYLTELHNITDVKQQLRTHKSPKSGSHERPEHTKCEIALGIPLYARYSSC